MSKKYKLLTAGGVTLVVILFIKHYLQKANFAVLSPAGTIGQGERHIMYLALLLSLLVIVPVFGLTLFITLKYRETNLKAKYAPEWDHNRLLETIWWGIPTVIILVLSIITWNSSHQLDPARPITSTNKTLKIQVVALQWKWLFIYPEQHIASVNFLQIPTNTPVNFEITSDAPMNSFWIPQLGGQIYAMPGMSTHLNLIASKVGNYRGSSANLSGAGFSNMTFTTRATSKAEFDAWALSTQHLNTIFTQAEYDLLALPSSYGKLAFYTMNDSGLYDRVVMKYMLPNYAHTTNPIYELTNRAMY